MKRRIALTLLAAAFTFPAVAVAGEKLSGKPNDTEAAFVASVSADLTARFPTPDAARKAGYLRYTDEDDSGAISYANRQWTSKDPEHPSQLWFDAKNRLIGADFSVPLEGSKPPELFGLRPERWQKFTPHAHYGLAGPTGTIYGGVGQKTLEKTGGSVAHPTARALVAAGIAKKVRDVRFTFEFPAIWDVAVWVIPNPDGAFAEKNPDVKPLNPPKEMKM
ncbi:MAG: hypothetical protein NVSMB19_11000 [Vulcanimicrobiaceae bacterium]